jgi:hypothetical protein
MMVLSADRTMLIVSGHLWRRGDVHRTGSWADAAAMGLEAARRMGRAA